MIRALVFALVALFAADALAANWSANRVYKGDYATWSEAGTTDSGVVCLPDGGKIDNTSAGDFTLYNATPSGTKMGEWLGPVKAGATSPSTASCSPADGNTSCGSAIVPPGCYVADPDGTGAGAQVHGGGY